LDFLIKFLVVQPNNSTMVWESSQPKE
jgi:hypothetical protein